MQTYFREPEVKVLDACVEVLLLVGLFEFLALLCRFIDKELPLFIQSPESCLSNRRVKLEQSYLLPVNLVPLFSPIASGMPKLNGYRIRSLYSHSQHSQYTDRIKIP